KKYSSPIKELADTKLELNPIVTKENLKSMFSPHQEKVISLLKYRGTATLHDIIKLMKLSETDAEKAAKGLLYHDIIRQIPSA
ncbi:MAG: hypothetical protein H7647_11465, partial [Candidatus Heimdallarchaeota archaeon]|nr:hypothetical protein [Candidatus Heimdallarchaeota archaeon]MCK4255045.1 hypothetical protein [Candidatus Heimdallarchaeota archaeon]